MRTSRGRRLWFAGLCLVVVTCHVSSGSQESLPKLFSGLKNPDIEARNRASQAVLSYTVNWIQQDPATMRKAFPAILAALDDDNADVRLQASAFFSGLGRFRKHDGHAILGTLELELIKRFDDPHPRVRANLMAAIASLGPAPAYVAQAIEAFEKHLNDPDYRVRGMAVVGLASAAPDSASAASAIISLIDRTTDPEARRGLLQRLAHAKPRHPAIIRKLIEQLDHDSTLLRQTTVRVLGEIGPPAAEALPKLYEIALDPSTPQELRQGAKSAIKSIGNVKQPDGGGAKQ